MTKLQRIQKKLDDHEDAKIVSTSNGEGFVELHLKNDVVVTVQDNGTLKVSSGNGDTKARDYVLSILTGGRLQVDQKSVETVAIIRELDRRIANVEKVLAWRKKTTEDYFESFKRYVAENLTIDDLASGHLSGRFQEACNAYHCWALTEAELGQLKALKEDIEKGRVNLDA